MCMDARDPDTKDEGAVSNNSDMRNEHEGYGYGEHNTSTPVPTSLRTCSPPPPPALFCGNKEGLDPATHGRPPCGYMAIGADTRGCRPQHYEW